jgi:hypothetical protein
MRQVPEETSGCAREGMRQKPGEPGEAEEDGQEEMRVTTAGEKRLMVYGSKSVLFAALPLSGCTQEETTANSRGDLQVRTSWQFLPAQASRRDAALVAAPEDSADLSDSRRRGPRVRARRSDHRAGFGQAHTGCSASDSVSTRPISCWLTTILIYSRATHGESVEPLPSVDVSPLARCDRDRAYPSVPLMKIRKRSPMRCLIHGTS